MQCGFVFLDNKKPGKGLFPAGNLLLPSQKISSPAPFRIAKIVNYF